jgi:formylglycine-generating enzyme required for sulfatase activity
VSLQQVYVDLDVALPARNEQDAVHGLELCLLGENNRERTALMTALTNLQANHIVLLGEPGSGKSTFINYLTYNLARIVSGDGTNHDFPSIFEDLWPMRLRLRDVAPHLAAKGHGNAGMVWDAVRADLVRNFGESAASKLFPYLQGRLMQKGIFLLDGLDEVPVANRGRECLIEAVQALLEQVPERRVLLTARPYAYVDPEWQLPGLPVLALKPFSTTQVNRFVQNWHLAMQPVMGWSPAEVNERNERLRIALRERHRLADLASRPLLLTLMTTLHTSWGRLPADRAELYEESVKLLLDRWQKAHSSYNPEHAESSSAITTKLYTDLSELRGALEELAYDAHVAQGKTVDRDHTPADISQDQVLAVLSRYLPRDVNPRSALPYLQNRVGLLVESHPKVYTFPHRSFQEYLAACFLAETKQDFGECLRDLVWDDMGWWREVFLLGLGKAKQGGIGNALNVLNTLVPSEPVDVMEPTCSHWRVAVLAGEGLLNLSPTNKTVQTPHYRALVRRVSRWLVLLIERGVLSASERAVAGDVLGQLGDLRFDSSFLYLPKTYQSIQEKYWGFIEVPAGPFVTKEGSKERQETIHYNYWMARYPITVAEYGSFVDDKGYEIRSYWSPVGWAWRTGEWDEQVENVGPRKWLKRRSVELRNRPMWWEKQQRHPNRPIVFVSWFEAVAYCAWLTEQLLSQDPSWLLGKDVDSLLLGARLPLVSEWEKAARGGDARCYPWGDEDWDAEKANIEESGISHASTVGLYPEGANPWGLHELSGNVWEWTNSRWAVESKKLIVCGGSWASARTDAHCSSRYSFFPSVAYFNIGFRVVIAPTKFQEIAPKTDSSSEL